MKKPNESKLIRKNQNKKICHYCEKVDHMKIACRNKTKDPNENDNSIK